MSNPLVSVIIPVYKTERYLDECMQSIVNQSFNNIEIIMVDDGSPDNCPEMCDKWAKKDGRIKVVHKTNGGLATARNAGIDVASGDYLLFVDSDDYIELNTVELLIKSALMNNSDIVLFGLKEISLDGKTLTVLPNVHENIVSSDYCLKRIYEFSHIHHISVNKLYKSDMWKDFRFPDFRKFEDEASVPLLYEKAKIVSVVEEPLYIYRRTPDSLTTSDFSQNDLLILDVFNFRLKHFKDKEMIKQTLLNYLFVLRKYYFIINFRNEYKNELDIIDKKYKEIYKLAVKNKVITDFKDKVLFLLLYINPKFYVFLINSLS